MTAAAVALPVVDADGLIAKAKKVLDENRGFTQAELQEFRDGLYRLSERGERLAHDTLRLVCAEVDRLAAERTQNAIIAQSTATINAQVEHQRRRPERWRALSPIARAAFLMDDGTAVGRAIAKFAALVEQGEATAQLTPPRNFESETF